MTAEARLEALAQAMHDAQWIVERWADNINQDEYRVYARAAGGSQSSFDDLYHTML